MKNKKYTHIKKTERLEIAILLKKGYGLREIAQVLERSPNTVSQEIKENSVNGVYDPDKANHKAYVKRKYSKYEGMKIVSDFHLRNYVEERIREDWSPEVIAGRLKNIESHVKYVGKGAIYKYIYSVYGRQIEQCLYHNAIPKKSGPKRKYKEKLNDRIFIDERPEYINNREDFGDWEGDFIVSGKDGKGSLLVLYERKSKYVLMKKLLSRDIKTVNNTIREITGGIICLNSLTLDNDISFKKHKELSELLRAPIYFCHPYHSWEKGGVENMNKLIRRYIPKKTDISKLSDTFIKETQDKFNHRPRKCLNFKTPYEIMKENNQFKDYYGILLETKNTLSKVLLKDECPA